MRLKFSGAKLALWARGINAKLKLRRAALNFNAAAEFLLRACGSRTRRAETACVHRKASN